MNSPYVLPDQEEDGTSAGVSQRASDETKSNGEELKMAGNKKLDLSRDLYGLLGITKAATPQEIKKAYRKKALTCHPDKNPDNPRAAELFHELSAALEILLDSSAKAAYDNLVKGHEEAQRRTRELDVKRRKFKEDLEAREKAAKLNAERAFDFTKKTDEERLQAEIERLRKQGSQELRREQELLREFIRQDLPKPPEMDIKPKLKIRWKAKKDDPSNGGYKESVLTEIFQKSLAYRNEKGLEHNPLTMEWVQGQPVVQARVQPVVQPEDPLDPDYEDMVLMKLVEAQRKRKQQS